MSALLRPKIIADNAQYLPEKWNHAVPKPALEEYEATALHNIMSALVNRPRVRTIVEQAMAAVCSALGVKVPLKKSQNKANLAATKLIQAEPDEQALAEFSVSNTPEDRAENIMDEDEWNGLSDHLSNNNESGEEFDSDSDNQNIDELTAEKRALKNFNAKLTDPSESNTEEQSSSFSQSLSAEDAESIDSYALEEEEQAVGLYEDRIAGSESCDDEEFDESAFAKLTEKYRGIETVKYDDISSSVHGSPVTLDKGEDYTFLKSDSDSNTEGFFREGKNSLSPPRKMKKTDQKTKTGVGTVMNREILKSHLPSLMGGYISGSESEASEIDVAPVFRKNKRGQRARQKIWELKYKDKAKHVVKAKKQEKKNDRNKGWDFRRGAVEDGEEERGVWKKGQKPWSKKRGGKDASTVMSGREEMKVAADHGKESKMNDNTNKVKTKREPSWSRRDNEGKLHPSWEAKKQAKEKQANTAFQGKKMVFD